MKILILLALMFSLTANAAREIRDLTTIFGTGASSNVKLEAEVGTNPNPAVRFDPTAVEWQFSNNGTDFSPIGITSASANKEIPVFGSFALAATTSTRTSTSMGPYGTSAAISGPSYTINDWGCTTTDVNKLAFTCANVPAGKVIVYVKAPIAPSTTATHSVAIFDGTTQATANAGSTTTAAGQNPSTIVGEFIYTTAPGSRTFELYGATATGNSVIDFSTSQSGGAVTFWIVHYPVPTINFSSNINGDIRTFQNTYSVRVSSAGVTSNETNEWITFNTISATSNFNFTLSSVAFPNDAPTCVCTTENASTGSSDICAVNSTTRTNTNLDIVTRNNANTALALAFNLTCTRGATDFKSNTSIIATFAEVLKTAGVTNPSLVSAAVDASEVITENPSAFITSCTNADPSVCTVTSSYFTADPKCWAEPTSAGTIAAVTADTTASITIDRTDASTPFKLFCHGAR